MKRFSNKPGIPGEINRNDAMNSKSKIRSPWFILFIVLLASIAAPLNQFKVPPVMPLLMEAFKQPAGAAGWLMSIFAVTGLLLAFPAGFIFQRLGYRLTGFIALFAIVLGSIWGIWGADFQTILFSRFIEGAGMSFMSIVAPAIIALFFAADQRGKAMGVWAVWVPLGSVIMFLLAPPIAARFHWQGVWWFGCGYTLLVGFLFYFYIPRKNPGKTAPENSSPETPLTLKDFRKVLSNPHLWLLSFLFCCFNTAFIAFVTWGPTFLHNQRGISLTDAAFRVSLVSVLAIIACPTAGWVSDKIGSRKTIMVWPMLLMGLLLPFCYGAGTSAFLFLVIAIGFVGGFVPTGVFAGAVEAAADERLTGMAMAVIQIGQNTGMLLGPLLFGWLVDYTGGWATGFWVLAPVCLAGAIAGWIAKVR
jgi:predicted MFS family arabinose efflux permease